MRIAATLVLLISLISCGAERTKIDELNSIHELAERIVGKENAGNFIFRKTESNSENDEFEIDFENGKVLVSGNSTIALASGLNWYLKYETNTDISWETRHIKLPEELPAVAKPIARKSAFTYSYYLNYCTFNYSMAFWDWARWEQEIDWMALNGVNLPLAIVGTEAVWKNTLKRLDFTQSEIDHFIPGPAFTGWWLMGNLEGWGGPVTDAFIQKQLVLQQKILKRMKRLGMNPVLPGFYGMVPQALKAKYPDADIRDQGLWAGGFQRPAFLSPTDSLFNTISKIYYEEMKKLYGDIQYFSGDPFHEGGITEAIDLPTAGKNIIDGVKAVYPKATWVFQGWGGNPQAPLLADIDPSNVLILDLDCDNRPQWEHRNGWDGKPWIWNTVTNFGGNVGMFGRMDVIAQEPFRALKQTEYAQGLKGIGAIPEGIENNSVIYELLFELKWHSDTLDLDQWLRQYVKRRYGKDDENLYTAWQILRKTVYGKKLSETESQQGTSESILCARPSLKIDQVSTWGTSKLYYDPSELLQAWTLFINEADSYKNVEGFQYDLLDITRQVLANYAQVVHRKMVDAYENDDKPGFDEASDEFLQLLDDQDQLLSNDDSFMLGKWIEEARRAGTTPSEKKLFEFNARTLITTWSFQNSNLHEYAHREWSGLLSDFYKPRWKMFIDYLSQKMEGQEPDEPDYYAFELAWTNQTGNYPSMAKQDPVEQAVRIYKNYHAEIESDYRDD